MSKWRVALACMLSMTVAGAATAGLPTTLASDAASGLKPGQFLWDESAESADTAGQPIVIMISIDRQHLYVWRGDRLIGVSTVSTGKPGKATPLGEFRILQKNVHHRSNIYSNAPMPYMQRLTWTGIALHGGELPGYPASHGCIRLPLAFARKLFAITDMGGFVSVSDAQAGPFLRIEAEIASLGTDAMPAWNGKAQPVRMAMSTPVAKAVAPVEKPPVVLARAPVVAASPPIAPKRVEVPPPPRLKVEKVVLAQADVSGGRAALQAPRIDPPREAGQPHWLVPYYADRDTGSTRK